MCVNIDFMETKHFDLKIAFTTKTNDIYVHSTVNS